MPRCTEDLTLDLAPAERLYEGCEAEVRFLGRTEGTGQGMCVNYSFLNMVHCVRGSQQFVAAAAVWWCGVVQRECVCVVYGENMCGELRSDERRLPSATTVSNTTVQSTNGGQPHHTIRPHKSIIRHSSSATRTRRKGFFTKPLMLENISSR